MANSTTTEISTATTASGQTSSAWVFGALLLGGAGIAMAAGGGGSSNASPSTSTPTVTPTVTGYLIDSPVAGVDYYLNGSSTLAGKTGADGAFQHKAGDTVTFKIGNIILAELVNVPADEKVYLQDLAKIARDNPTDAKVIKLAQLIQSLDSDSNPNNGITIDASKLNGVAHTMSASTNVADLLDAGVAVVSPQNALDHVNNNDPALINADNTKPTVLSIEMSDTALKAGETAIVTVTFSEAVKTFDGIISAENGTLTPVPARFPANIQKYTFTPNADVSDTSNVIKVSDAYTDLAGNKGVESISDNYSVETISFTASEVFHNMGLHHIGDNSIQGASPNQILLGDVGGYYRTMFEMAAASYAHPAALYNVPTMAARSAKELMKASEQLKTQSLKDLQEKGVGFDIAAEELGLIIGVNNNSLFGNFSVDYANGCYVAYNTDGIDTSSAALVGRSKDALFLAFRGTDGTGDMAEDALFGPVGMNAHYSRFEPLIKGLLQHAKDNGINKIYVGGHSLGGEMATMFMQNHSNSTITFESVTFAPANKALGNSLSDDRTVSFEMHEDWVADLDYTNLTNPRGNYGNTVVHLNYEAEYGRDGSTAALLSTAHYMTSFNDQIDKVFAKLPLRDQLLNLDERYYVDDNADGVIETKNDSPNWNAASVLENNTELLATAYNFNLVFSNTTTDGTLVIKPLDFYDGDAYDVVNSQIKNVIIANDAVSASENFNLNAQAATHGVFLIGNDAENIIIGSGYNDVLMGSGGVDKLIGGAGDDQLYGADYKDKADIFNVANGYFTQAGQDAVNQYAGADVLGADSYMIGGEGKDTLACAYEVDYGFINYNSASKADIDTVWNFNADLTATGQKQDYFVFSAAQLGLTWSSIDSIGSAWGDILGRKAYDINVYNYLNTGTQDGVMFYTGAGALFYDLDGDDAKAGSLLAKLKDTNGGDSAIDGNNILIVENFDGLNYNAIAKPNSAPVINTAESALAVAVNEDSMIISVAGQIVADDADHDKLTHTITQATYGTMTIDALGKWTYALNNANAAVQALKTNEKLTDSAVVTVDDGHGGMATSTVSVTINGVDEAPTTYTYKGHTYMLTSSAMTWTDAEAQAVAHGGHLVTVNDQAEQDWLVNTFGVSEHQWIGLNDIAQEGNFVWSSGEDASYRNFKVGEPNNGVGENYVGMWQGSGAWNDYTDINSRGLIEIPSAPSLAGPDMIDLGSYGKLIAPVHIDNNGDDVADSWFYYWDRSADGTSASTGSLNGGVDYVNHDVLDGIFNFASDFTTTNPNVGVNTDNTYRYATLDDTNGNHIKVALPTLGTSEAYLSSGRYLNDNQNYNDLAKIWDTANNGSRTSGVPAGWQSNLLWSATPSAYENAHAHLSNDDGNINSHYDLNALCYVALQVL